jgi:hypothetical protein
LPQAFEPRPNPDGARVFTRQRGVSVTRGEAFAREHGAVKFHLLVQLGVSFAVMQPVLEASQ